MCAAEASGDRLGAELVAHLRSTVDLEATGLAGPRMRDAGVHAIARAEDATAFGLLEVVTQLPGLVRLGHRLGREIRAWRPDVVLTIDSPGLMLRVGRRAKTDGFRVVHWVCPQVWAWRSARIARISAAADTLMCLLPFEPPLFEATSLNAVFVGHPAANAAVLPVPVRVTFLLVPGSRREEIRRLWPVCRRVAQRLRIRFPDCRFVVPMAPGVRSSDLPGLDVDFTRTFEPAHAALVTSGTATLDLAARGIPMVVIYQVHPATWAIGRQLVRGVDHVALPNILAGRQIVPEILQELDPGRIADRLAALVGPEGDRQRIELEIVSADLDGDQALTRAGQIVAGQNVAPHLHS